MPGADQTSSAAAPPGGPDRLLLLLQADAAAGAGPALEPLRLEGWRVLGVSCRDTDTSAEHLLATAQAALERKADTARLVIVADTGTATVACRMLALWNDRGSLPRACGLLIFDATDPAAEPLGGIATLSTIIVARRGAAEARSAGLAGHRALQALGRDSRFLVVDDVGPAAGLLADATGPVGRELRWLLDPVHSRTDPATA